jgi:hypothetical protein
MLHQAGFGLGREQRALAMAESSPRPTNWRNGTPTSPTPIRSP